MTMANCPEVCQLLGWKRGSGRSGYPVKAWLAGSRGLFTRPSGAGGSSEGSEEALRSSTGEV